MTPQLSLQCEEVNMSQIEKVGRHTAIQVRDFDTGIVKRYPSVLEAALYEDPLIEGIMRKVRTGPQWVDLQRKQYRVDLGDAEWPKETVSRWILVLDTETGKVTRHTSQMEVAKIVGLTNGQVHCRLDEKSTGLIRGRYAIKSENDPQSWDEIKESKPRTVTRRNPEFIDLDDQTLGEYRFLPEYPTMRIYRSGIIVDKDTGRKLGSPNHEGYWSIPYIKDEKKTSLRVHRLVAMAYHGCPENMHELHVNHIDFDPSNNAADNLEWVTPYENNLHSALHNREGGIRFKPIQVRIFDTKEVRYFNSMVDCAREFLVHKDNIQLRANIGDGKLWEDRLQFRLDQGDAPWNEQPSSDFVHMLDIHTGKVTVYKNSNLLAIDLKMSPAALSINLNKKKGYPFMNRYVFRFEFDEYQFPKIDNIFDYLLEHTQLRPITIHNPTTGHTRTFESAVDCASAMGLKTNTLNMRLASGKPEKVYADGYRYCYYGSA